VNAGERHDDERIMRLALALGRRHNGRTWPNPSVGAVVAEPASSRIIAQGVTAPGGRPHAEPLALAAAGGAARGATLHVSLEPCSHHGRTPPCVEAILAAGIARVVTALQDPDARVAGRGHAMLRSAGIDVVTGVLSEEAERAHRGHLTRIREGRPAVILKLARTADGFAAAGPGEPRLMISGEGVWARVHLLRAHADAIMVGISTILADDPRLDVRLDGLAGRSPVRIVLDSRLRLPASARLVTSAREHPTWALCADRADGDAEARLRERGVDVIRIAEDRSGRLDLATALRAIAGRGLTRVLCEGGPMLADALGRAGALDEIVLVTGRRRLDRPGVAAVGPALASAVSSMRLVETEIVGDDRIEHFERAPCSPAS